MPQLTPPNGIAEFIDRALSARRTYGPKKSLPPALRALYARWRHRETQRVDAENAYAVAKSHVNAAELELLHAMVRADRDLEEDDAKLVWDHGTASYQVSRPKDDAERKFVVKPPDWVADEIAKFEREERNADRDE